ncbi:MAG: branched-chain amino acid transport system permease protein livM [Actinomycetota bacterium]|jgi:branched-chain amino acid transport system permease protein|nr:branched-chain amino acid transport system permease protein livM [Actinomycetota bacterium]
MTAILEGNDAGRVAARWAATAAGLVVAYFAANALLPQGLPPGIILLGGVFGSFYALTAIGLVLIYRANRVINFAQADVGAVAGVLAIEFRIHGMPYVMAIGLGLVIAAGIGALVNVAVIRRFRNAPRLIVAVATIGVAQILAGIAVIIPLFWKGSGNFTTPFEFSFRVNPAVFHGNEVVAMIVAPLMMLAVAAFLRFSDYGVVIRAAAENGDRASLLGVPVPRLSTIVWAMAAVLSATAVMLRVPILGFTSFLSVSGAGNALLLRTLAAAVIGRMENLPRTVVAAIAIGIFERSAEWQVPRTTVVDAMLVVIILVALFLQRGFFSRVAETGISTWNAIKEVRPIPAELRNLPEVKWAFRGLRLALLAFIVTFPMWAAPSKQAAMTLIFVYSMIAVSLLILTGWAGHISLGQFALVGFGAATTSVLYGRHHWDFTLALVAGVVVTALVALVIGIPALRIRGPFLAVTTLAFAVTSSTFFLEDRYLPWFIVTGISRPVLWGRLPLEENWQMYFFALACLMLTIWVTRNLRNSHTGRVLIAVRDNEIQAEANGMNSTRLKLQAFVISGAIAGFAGGVYVLTQNGLNTDSYDAAISIKLFSMVVIGGLGSLPGAILGAVYVRAAEFFLPAAYSLLASGFGILFLLIFLPEGLGGLVYRARDGYLRRVARKHGLVVPSLLADKRVVAEDAPVVIDTALSGLTGGHEHDGNGNGASTNGSSNGSGRRRRTAAPAPPPDDRTDLEPITRDLTGVR